MSHEKLDLDNIKPAQEIGTKPVRGLQSKLITLTIIFVMLAEVLAFVPSVANTRLRWLEDRLNTAAAASIVFESQQVTELSAKVQSDTLMSTGTKAIILRKDGTSRIVASEEMPPAISASYDLDNTGPLAAIMDAFETLIWGGDRIIRVLGAVGESNDFQIELIISDDQLRHAMLIYSRNVLFISLIIAAITAGLLFFTINRLMLQPIRRLTWSMQNFSDNPADATRIIKPDDGDEE